MLQISDVSITEISSVVPNKFINNKENKTKKKLIKNIGVNTRHIADENISSVDLCVAAAKKIFDSKRIHPNDISCVIFVSQTPEFQLPASSIIIQDMLKLPKKTLGYDINLGCSGYTHGLFLAASLINSGLDNILLLNGDTVSKTIDLNDSGTNLLFGDAGCASLIKKTLGTHMVFSFGQDGSGYNSIILNNKFTKRKNENNDTLTMNGAEVFTFTLKRIPKLIEDLLSYSKNTINSIDYFIFHQANLFMLKSLSSNIGIPLEKFPLSIEKYGNTASASIPLTISLNSNISGKVLLAGFGVGLSWSAVITDLSCTNIHSISQI